MINFDFPRNIEEYVHRVGRTGRAGKSGTSITFMEYRDRKNARDLIKVTIVFLTLDNLALGFQISMWTYICILLMAQTVSNCVQNLKIQTRLYVSSFVHNFGLMFGIKILVITHFIEM